MQFASRAGEKLQHALTEFHLSVEGLTVADFGSSTGGFVDCLLQNGASKVYSVDTAYGELAWKLRNDQRVVVLERTNAMHVVLPELVPLITVDTSWTRQKLVLPNVFKNLKKDGRVISLIKPHYESDAKFISKGKLQEDHISIVLEQVKDDIRSTNGELLLLIESPLVGEKRGNKEYLALIRKIDH